MFLTVDGWIVPVGASVVPVAVVVCLATDCRVFTVVGCSCLVR